MTISDAFIIEKLNNRNPLIEDAQKLHAHLLMQVHGIGVTEWIKKIEGLENEEKVNLRKRLAKSNKSMWGDVLRFTDKIFIATGGSREYFFKNKKKSNEFREILGNITEGLSLRKWLENYWLDKIAVDPNGVFLIENNGKDAYPTYKSISVIADYQADGQDLDYIIFEPEKVEDQNYELLRVYDDESDRTYKKTGDELEVIKSYPNTFKKVPGVIISDIVDPLSGLKASSISKELDDADEYLRLNTVFTLMKYHHGFPFFWMYMTACPVCKGTTMVGGKECHACNGTGLSTKKDVSDITYIKPPEDKEQPLVAPNLAGYVVPPIESIQWLRTELDSIKSDIKFSHWGTVLELDKSTIEKTATEVTINAQPIQDRLNKYSDSEEIVEKKLTDFLGVFYYPDNYIRCSINNGRNYIIKNHELLLREYVELRNNRSGETALNDKLKQYYESLFQNDVTNLVIRLKLIEVEPLVHYSVDEVVGMQIPESIKKTKVLYNEWLSTLDKEYLFSSNVEELRNSLNTYVESKKYENEVQSNGLSVGNDNKRKEVPQR